MLKYFPDRPIVYRLLIMFTLVLFAGGCAGIDHPPPPGDDARLGIEIQGIRYTAAGYMLDFRYKVIAPEKALPIFARSAIPYLVHEKSGAKFMVPSPAKLGPFKSTTRKPEAGRKYFIMFANPGKYVKQGDLITVVVGEYRFEHLEVK